MSNKRKYDRFVNNITGFDKWLAKNRQEHYKRIGEHYELDLQNDRVIVIAQGKQVSLTFKTIREINKLIEIS